MKLSICTNLVYQLDQRTDFLFQLHAANSSGQTVTNENLSISNIPRVEVFEGAVGNRMARAQMPPGKQTVTYRADVEVRVRSYDPATVAEFAFSDLPTEILVYLLPSRFCPSDLFTQLAEQQFSRLPRGYSRALAVSDWVHSRLAYVPGSTGPHSTSADAFQQGKGVCRDFAHVAISVLRAAGIPARYVSVYADGLNPPDFHAIVEAYLSSPDGGAWFALDPTHMSSSDAIARIAAGRDAADVAFAWTLGDTDATQPEVLVSAPARTSTNRTTLAVVGA
jgi:transglutaminase-like putative cysteine protease